MFPNIFYTVNSGLIISDETTTLMIDCIHGCALRFSYTPSEVLDMYFNRSGLLENLTASLFTHIHDDHCDYFYLEQLRRDIDKTQFFCPGIAQSRIDFSPAAYNLRNATIGSFTVWALYTNHDGGKAFQVPNVSYLIKNECGTIFIAGDSKFTEDDMCTISPLGKIDCGFFNTYQVASADQIDFIRSLDIDNIYLYHLPFPEDDSDGYIPLAKQLMRHFPTDLPKIKYAKPMSFITF